MTTEIAAVNDQITSVISSTYLEGNDNKGKLTEYQKRLNVAWTEYNNYVTSLIDGTTAISKVSIAQANSLYSSLQNALASVKQYVTLCQGDLLSAIGNDIASYRYLKNAMTYGKTTVTGGLILSSAIELKDIKTDGTIGDVTAGINGVTNGLKSSIASWYGGPMVDRVTVDGTADSWETGSFTTTPGTDYAMSLFRHDGSGYLAGGKIWWEAGSGNLHVTPNSFVLEGQDVALYMLLFKLNFNGLSSWANMISATPQKPFTNLRVLSTKTANGITIGDSTSGGRIVIGNIVLSNDGKSDVLEITNTATGKIANVGVSGGISAYGTYTPSTGGGGGLSGTIIPYSTAIVSDPQNEGSKIASASSIYKLHSRISAIETNGATSIAVTGTGNAITSVSKNGTSITFTKGATFLTSHQSLADYLTKSEASSTYQPKGNYLTSHQSLSNYYTKSQVDTIVSGKSSTSHTHSVIINGTTKIIAASGGAAVNLGNYLTSHQSLADYAKKSEIPTKVSQLSNDAGYLTTHQSLANYVTINDSRLSDSRYPKFANNTWYLVGDDAYIGDHNVGGQFCIMGNNGTTGLSFHKYGDASISKSITFDGTTLSIDGNANYASSAGNADTVDGEHASAFTRIVGRHSIGTSGTAPYNYIHLFRIANSSGYSTIDCEIDFRTRYHSAKLEIRISTAQNPYNSGGTSISIIKKVVSNRTCNFWVLPTVQTSNYNYYDVYYESGAWNSGSYGITLKGNNGILVFEHKGTKLTSLPDKVFPVSNNVATSATKLQTPRTIWGQSFDGTADISISAAAKMPFVLFKRFDNDENAGYIGCGSSSNNNIYIESYVNSNIILGLNSNVGIGDTSPGYKLCVSGDIYATNAIRSSKKNQAIVLSNFSSPAWISALDGQIIFNTGNAIRFGETAWDWTQWAGLKYTHSNKTIYLGIADGSTFNSNSAQSDGTLRLAGIKTVTPDSGARIGNTGGDLYLGNSNNSAWVKVQDMCSQLNSNWRIYQNGGAVFNSLTINSGSTFNGAVKVNNILTAKAIMFTTADVNTFDTNINNWDGSIGANVTNMFNGIDSNNISMEYSTNEGSSWVTYSTNPNYLFNLINDNSDTENFVLGNNVMSGSSDAAKLAQIKRNQLRVTVKIPPEVYQELAWISVDVNNGVNIKCQVYFGNSSGVYREYVSKIMVGWSHRCDICVGPLNVNIGNNDYRYVRLVFSHLSSHTALRNGIVSRIRALALTKYNNPSGRYNISTTGHIYNYDYNMNTYFPNSILAKGGVTAYQSSDVRLKTNITKLNCLNVIKSIGGTYEFDYLRDHKHSIGFIAQHVNNPLLKDIVAKDKDGYLKINYWSPKLISLAFGALTEIDNEVDKLKARVRELETEVEYLKNKDYVLQ